MSRKKTKAKTKTKRRTAATSDRYELYEQSVQEPQDECEFIEQIWSEHRRRRGLLERREKGGAQEEARVRGTSSLISDGVATLGGPNQGRAQREKLFVQNHLCLTAVPPCGTLRPMADRSIGRAGGLERMLRWSNRN